MSLYTASQHDLRLLPLSERLTGLRASQARVYIMAGWIRASRIIYEGLHEPSPSRRSM